MILPRENLTKEQIQRRGHCSIRTGKKRPETDGRGSPGQTHVSGRKRGWQYWGPHPPPPVYGVPVRGAPCSLSGASHYIRQRKEGPVHAFHSLGVQKRVISGEPSEPNHAGKTRTIAACQGEGASENRAVDVLLEVGGRLSLASQVPAGLSEGRAAHPMREPGCGRP